MNGIHAVVLATGNDTRGAEASAHATRVVTDSIGYCYDGVTIKIVND